MSASSIEDFYGLRAWVNSRVQRAIETKCRSALKATVHCVFRMEVSAQNCIIGNGKEQKK